MSYLQRRKFLWALFLAGLLAFLFAALVTKATTFACLTFADLAKKSTAVARLRCVGSKTMWDHGELWTETQFAVVEIHKGSLPPSVAIRLMGGSDGNLRSYVDGVPQFRAGEEVYLFLWNRPGESYRVLGWSQGTFRIARNPFSGAESVTQESFALSIFDPRTRTFERSGIRNLPVSLFRERLREALAQASQ